MYQVTSQAIRVAILVAAVTGFRRSEIRGLKWRDIDFVGWTITPVRGSIRRHLSNLKSDASGATVPIPEALVVALQQLRTECLYPGDEDWIFASVQRAGKSPLWFDAALQRQLRPAAIRAGITKHVGWHTFRHSLATLLVMKREGIKVVQELMRHADSRTTLDIYSRSDDEDKRAAQKHVFGLVRSRASQLKRYGNCKNAHWSFQWAFDFLRWSRTIVFLIVPFLCPCFLFSSSERLL
jgi:integrase